MQKREWRECSVGMFVCIVLTVVCLGCAGPVGKDVGQVEPEREKVAQVIISKTDEPVHIDGILDDSAWESAEALPIAVIHNQAGAMLDKPVGYAWLSWDDDNLYVAFDVHTTDIRAKGKERDEGSVSPKHDVVEVFIDVNGDEEHFFEFHVNPWNAFNDLFIIRPRPESPLTERLRYGIMFLPEWNMTEYETAVQVRGEVNNPDVEDEGWTVEIRLPFASLMMPSGGRSPAVEDEWRVQLVIQDGTKEYGHRYVAWSPTYESWFHHSIETWGRVQFGATVSRDSRF